MEINKVQEASAQALTTLNAEVAARWSAHPVQSGTGHVAEMCRPPFDPAMSRNSRIDDREDQLEPGDHGGFDFLTLGVAGVIVTVAFFLGRALW